jgi:amino acid transporter
VVSLVGLNILGVKESGFVQNILVYTKTAFLFFIAFVGIYFFNGTYYSVSEFFNEGLLTPISVFAIIFVAYEGFQLICYDYHVIKNVKKNLARAMYISIITAMVIYISVSFMATLHLTPEMATLHGEYALAEAVVPFIGSIGFTIVVLVALQSTASGINATLFGTSRLMRRVAHHEELPNLFSYTNKKRIPIYSLLILGGITATFTFFGSLEEITIFGSIIFLIADGVGNYVNLKFYKETKSKAWIPAMGLAGCVVALPIVIHHLFVNDPSSFVTIFILFFSLFILNLVYILKRRRTDQG